jgi:hypothetical protein
MNAKIRKLLAIMVGVLCSLTAMFALAGDWSGKKSIGKITVREGQIIQVFPASGAWSNPDVCDSAAKIILVGPGGAGAVKAYKEIYASLLGAHLTDRKIRAYLVGCKKISGKTYPLLKRVEVF